jgi:hypothetical protein
LGARPVLASANPRREVVGDLLSRHRDRHQAMISPVLCACSGIIAFCGLCA